MLGGVGAVERGGAALSIPDVPIPSGLALAALCFCSRFLFFLASSSSGSKPQDLKLAPGGKPDPEQIFILVARPACFFSLIFFLPSSTLELKSLTDEMLLLLQSWLYLFT